LWPKWGPICRCVKHLSAQIDGKALHKRQSQGWLMESSDDLVQVVAKAKQAKRDKRALSIGYLGNVVDLWLDI
jgi:urocanate hydratase